MQAMISTRALDVSCVISYFLTVFNVSCMCPKIWCDKYNANFFWTKPGLSISRQAINYWQMRSLQRGASPSDQAEKNKVHSVQVCIALEAKARGRTAGKLRDDGLHPSTTGSKRWPRTASSSSRSSPALENVSPPHGNSIVIANLIIIHIHMIPVRAASPTRN